MKFAAKTLAIIAPLALCACSVLNMGLYETPPYAFPSQDAAKAALEAPFGPQDGTRAVKFSEPEDFSGARIYLFSKENIRPAFGQRSAPLAIGDLAVFGDSMASARAVSLKDGRTIWEKKLAAAIYSTPVYAGGNIVFADDSGRVTALGLDGVEKWTVSVAYPVVADLLSDGERVYILASDQKVYCLGASDGATLWQYGSRIPRDSHIWRATGLALSGDLYAGTAEGYVIKIDARDGNMIWRSKVADKGLFADVTAGPCVDGGVVYAATRDGALSALDASSGKILWSKEGGAAAGFAVIGEKIFYGTQDGAVNAISKEGASLWSVKPVQGQEKLPSFVMAAGGEILAGYYDEALYALDASNGRVLRSYSTGSGMGAMPFISDSGMVLHSNLGNLHWIERKK